MPGKVIPIILEGTSDAGTLVDAFNRLIDDTKELKELCEGGDLTLYRLYANGRQNVGRLDPLSMVRRTVLDDMSIGQQYSTRDVLAVMQIVDLDGAMIPDSAVIDGDGRLEYRSNGIATTNREGVIARNHEKSNVVRMLRNAIDGKSVTLTGGKRVPYYPFHMSRNLEHVMWGDSKALTPQQKTLRANRKNLEYASHPEQLLSDLGADDVVHGHTDYSQSWQWPFEGLNSLHRGSNAVFLPDIVHNLTVR